MDGFEIRIGTVDEPFAEDSFIFQNHCLPPQRAMLRRAAVEESGPSQELIILAVTNADAVHLLIQNIPVHEEIVETARFHLETVLLILQVRSGQKKMMALSRTLVDAVILQRRFQKQVGRKSEHRKKAETPRFQLYLFILPLPCPARQ